MTDYPGTSGNPLWWFPNFLIIDFFFFQNKTINKKSYIRHSKFPEVPCGFPDNPLSIDGPYGLYKLFIYIIHIKNSRLLLIVLVWCKKRNAFHQNNLLAMNPMTDSALGIRNLKFVKVCGEHVFRVRKLWKRNLACVKNHCGPCLGELKIQIINGFDPIEHHEFFIFFCHHVFK